ncbi:sel1 repeat family protein [Hymenobacter sp. J193]|uniref:tetratricopeptide repeat protein n=1 Tax=Hymenobacter sp. J193 TaxID=2898429 RepID=UPI002150B8DF|nr:tetratricopeptide repeat protein [Hymenobacter sp. J193]MCR5886364.1 sel1 repeat family protein [Hymenobacter sp. J193]
MAQQNPAVSIRLRRALRLIHRANFGRYATNRYIAQARTQLELVAKAGNSTAMYWLGMFYHDGWGVAQNDQLMIHWLKKAAAAGHRKAAYNIGVAYDTGTGVAKNLTKSFRYYHQAANAGKVEAMHATGTFYYWGEGVQQDYAKARNWFRKSARHGHADSMCELGRLYQRSVSGYQSHRWATYWFRRAVEAGSTKAHTFLGLEYTISKNWEQARHYLEAATELSQSDAMYFLGLWAEEGWSSPSNLVDARFWFRQAAELHHEKAALHLALLEGEEF